MKTKKRKYVELMVSADIPDKPDALGKLQRRLSLVKHVTRVQWDLIEERNVMHPRTWENKRKKKHDR